MKKYLMLFICVFLLFDANAVFAFDAEEIERYLDEVNSGHVDHKSHEKTLKKTTKLIERELGKSKTDPYLWYLKGRSSFGALKIRGVLNGRKGTEYKTLQKLIPTEYKNALELNEVTSVLNEKQLMNMIGSDWIWTETARQYITLKQSKTTLTQKEHLTLLWERVIFGLIRQNKFDEAYEEMAKMEASFPSEKLAYANGKPWRVKLDEKVEKQKAKLEAEKVSEEKPVEEETKSEPEPEKKPEVSTAVVPNPELTTTTPVSPPIESPPLSEDANLKWYLLLAGVLVIALVIAMRRKSSRSG